MSSNNNDVSSSSSPLPAVGGVDSAASIRSDSSYPTDSCDDARYRSKVVSLVLNGALGDTYGAPLEMMPSDSILTRYGRSIDAYITTSKVEDKPYTYTDDTQMSIALIHCLIDHPYVSPSEGDHASAGAGTDAHNAGVSSTDGQNESLTRSVMVSYYVRYFEPSRGYSMSTYNQFTDYISDPSKPILVATKHSNGGLMRVAPLVTLLRGRGQGRGVSDEQLYAAVEVAHYPTHVHAQATHTSYIFIKLLNELINIDADGIFNPQLLALLLSVIDRLRAECTEQLNPELRLVLRTIVDRIDEDEYLVLDDLIGLDGVECFEAFGCALWCVVKSIRLDLAPSKILGRVITYGGDTDTIGSICGQMSAALFGAKSINPKWIATLENREMLTRIANKLVDTTIKRSREGAQPASIAASSESNSSSSSSSSA